MTLLDAYAVISLLADEPAADAVGRFLRRDECRMTTLGVAEVIDRMARVYSGDPEEVAVDVASLGLASPVPLNEAIATLAGRLRAAHYHRTSRAVSMADCVLAAAAATAGEQVATSDPHLLGLCQAEGIDVLALPASDGSVWS